VLVQVMVEEFFDCALFAILDHDLVGHNAVGN
jgi:hypothetical protein